VLGTGFSNLTKYIESPFMNVTDPHFMITFEYSLMNFDPV